MKDLNEATGGISSPVISPAVGDYSTLLQGLILLGMRQIKQQGCNACILDYVRILAPPPHGTSSNARLAGRWRRKFRRVVCDGF
jgi:hypothetical protein